MDSVVSVLKFEKGKQMPEDYPTAFKEAFAVFRHARVYDAISKKLKLLNPIPPELLQGQNGDLDFLGPDLSPSVAVAIAQGNLDPCTMMAFDHLPQTGYQHDLGSPDTASHLSRQEETTDSMQGGCFTIVSLHKTAKKRIRDPPRLQAVLGDFYFPNWPTYLFPIGRRKDATEIKMVGDYLSSVDTQRWLAAMPTGTKTPKFWIVSVKERGARTPLYKMVQQ